MHGLPVGLLRVAVGRRGGAGGTGRGKGRPEGVRGGRRRAGRPAPSARTPATPGEPRAPDVDATRSPAAPRAAQGTAWVTASDLTGRDLSPVSATPRAAPDTHFPRPRRPAPPSGERLAARSNRRRRRPAGCTRGAPSRVWIAFETRERDRTPPVSPSTHRAHPCQPPDVHHDIVPRRTSPGHGVRRALREADAVPSSRWCTGHGSRRGEATASGHDRNPALPGRRNAERGLGSHCYRQVSMTWRAAGRMWSSARPG